MGGDTIKYLTCNSDAFRVTKVFNKMNYSKIHFHFRKSLLFCQRRVKYTLSDLINGKLEKKNIFYETRNI